MFFLRRAEVLPSQGADRQRGRPDRHQRLRRGALPVAAPRRPDPATHGERSGRVDI